MKKLVLLVLAAGVLMPVLTASADYLDCNGKYHTGSPAMGQCYYLVDPNSDNNDNSVDNSSGYNSDDDDYNNDYDSSDNYDPGYNSDDDSDSGDTYKKNYRDYCVGDWCWVIYDECYNENYCWQVKQKYPRDEYDQNYNPDDEDYTRNRGNTWNYWINNYINNYYFMGTPSCDYRYQNCVYRGQRFGGWNNNYWWGNNNGYNY